MRYCLPAGVLALLGVCLLGLSGCASSPPTRLYVLPSSTTRVGEPPDTFSSQRRDPSAFQGWSST